MLLVLKTSCAGAQYSGVTAVDDEILERVIDLSTLEESEVLAYAAMVRFHETRTCDDPYDCMQVNGSATGAYQMTRGFMESAAKKAYVITGEAIFMTILMDMVAEARELEDEYQDALFYASLLVTDQWGNLDVPDMYETADYSSARDVSELWMRWHNRSDRFDLLDNMRNDTEDYLRMNVD